MKKLEYYGRNRKAIAPVRVSGRGQEGNTSWITQKREIEEYCKEHGLELVEIIKIVESAKISELRKKYAATLKRALRQNIQHLIFHKYDREARNLTDNETNEMLVREGKVVLHYVADGKTLHKNSPDTDFLMRDYHAVQNKHYSRDLSTKVRKATVTKAEEGWWPGCVPPHGYQQKKNTNKRGFERRRGSIIVRDSNPKTVKRVIREFELRAEEPTPTYVEIRDRIIGENLIPKDEIKNYYAGNIQRRLQNIFYDGRFTWHGVEYKGLHERIIPQELFWKVQATFGLKNPYRKNLNALFGQEWLKCSECGCSIIYDPKEKTIITTGEKKLYKYYRCSNGRKAHKKLVSVSEDSLLEQFSGAVRQISIREDFRDELMGAVNEAFNKMAQASKDDIDRYKAALESLRAREDRAYDLFDTGDIDKETYNRQRKRLQEEQVEYTELMDRAQGMINTAGRETVQSIIELATNAESLWNHMTNDERRSLLNKLLSNRSLDGVSVRYEIVKPLRTLSEMKEKSNWRRG